MQLPYNVYDSSHPMTVLLATLIRADAQELQPGETKFVTGEDHSIQVGVLSRLKGTKVEPHQHLPSQKTVSGCQEVLIVKKGRIYVQIFSSSDQRNYVTGLTLFPGDIYIQFWGGHSFTFEEDTEFIEIKQGPYTPADKVFFNPLAHEQTK